MRFSQRRNNKTRDRKHPEMNFIIRGNENILAKKPNRNRKFDSEGGCLIAVSTFLLMYKTITHGIGQKFALLLSAFLYNSGPPIDLSLRVYIPRGQRTNGPYGLLLPRLRCFRDSLSQCFLLRKALSLALYPVCKCKRFSVSCFGVTWDKLSDYWS